MSSAGTPARPKAGLAGETGYLVINKLVNPLSALILLIIIGRNSSQLLGQYALITTIFFVLQVLPSLGLAQFVMREVARKPRLAGAYYTTVAVLSFASSGILGAGLYALSHTTVYDPEIMRAIGLIGWIIFPGILAFWAELILISLRRALAVAVVPTLESVARIAISAWVVQTGGNIVDLVWVLLATRVASFVAYLFVLIVRAGVIPTPLPSRELMRGALHVMPVFFVHLVLLMVLVRMDYIVLSLFVTDAEVGYYTIAYRVYEVPLLLATAFTTAVFPSLARQFAYAPARLAATARLAFMAAIALAIPLSALGYAMSDVYVAWLFAGQYPEPVPLARCYALVLVLGVMDLFMSSLLHATDRQKDDLFCISCGSAVYAVGLVALIPAFGGYGAVTTTVAALSVQFTLRLTRFRRHFGPVVAPRELAMGLAAAAAVLVVIVGVSTVTPGWWFDLLITLLVLAAYPFLLMAFGLFRPLRLVRFTRRARTMRPESTMAGLLDRIGADLRRHVLHVPRRPGLGSWGWCAVLLYRLSRFAQVRGHRVMARLLWQGNLMLTKLDISPENEIGPGFVVTHPSSIIVSARFGSNVTLFAHAGAGRDGTRDVGAGSGIPILGDGVVIEPRAVVLGGIVVADHSIVAPHALVHGRRVRTHPAPGTP